MGGAKSDVTTASSSLLAGRGGKKNWRDAYVNGTPFTIACMAFAAIVFGAVITAAAMIVAGGAKEAQELGPVDSQYTSKVYGSKHAGVGFANYVVGNAVQNFWEKNIGHKPGPGGKAAGGMTDPFGSFLNVKKGKKHSSSSEEDDTSSSSSSDGPDVGDESPEKEADDAQQVDVRHHKIGAPKTAGAAATDGAIQHVQDVAEAHDEDKNADKGAAHLLRLLRTGRSNRVSKTGPAPHLHAGMFREPKRGRSTQASGAAQQLLQAKMSVESENGIPTLKLGRGASKQPGMSTLMNAAKDSLQATPGHVEKVTAGGSRQASVPRQRDGESYFAYKYRISH